MIKDICSILFLAGESWLGAFINYLEASNKSLTQTFPDRQILQSSLLMPIASEEWTESSCK